MLSSLLKSLTDNIFLKGVWLLIQHLMYFSLVCACVRKTFVCVRVFECLLKSMGISNDMKQGTLSVLKISVTGKKKCFNYFICSNS